MDELLAFVHAQLDDEQAWAEGCQGHRWVWECTEGDDVAEPNPVEEETLADGESVALRSVERKAVDYASWTLSATTPISHAEEVMSAAAGHILRHDPARTLRDVQARRTTLLRCQEEMLSGIPRLVWFARMTVWEMAQRWNDHDAFKEDWKP